MPDYSAAEIMGWTLAVGLSGGLASAGVHLGLESASKAYHRRVNEIVWISNDDRGRQQLLKCQRVEDAEPAGAKNSIAALIAKGAYRDDILLLLNSNHGFDRKQAKGRNAEVQLIYQLRQALMKRVQASRLRVIVLLDGTKNDLRAGIDNPDIDHLVVAGHGAWSNWTDANGERVQNHDGVTPLEVVNGEKIKRKKSFIRFTCGQPWPVDQFEDQLGTPFAERVFGRAVISDDTDFEYEPFWQTDRATFETMKKRGEISPIEREKLTNERHRRQRINYCGIEAKQDTNIG